jgi:hypothetical protein
LAGIIMPDRGQIMTHGANAALLSLQVGFVPYLTGRISLAVPKTANAELSARVSNGAISSEGLDLRVSEQSRRRLDGRLGTGGPMIRLETTNGAIRVTGRD